MGYRMALLALAVAGPVAARPAAPVEVMIVGTYHMDNPGLDLANVKADDVLKPARQKELEALSRAIATFHPTKIAVERVARTAELLDHRYAEFAQSDLSKVRDERYQVGYRLAHDLGLKQVYAIDEDPGPGEPDYFPFDKVMGWAKANGKASELDAMLEHAKLEAGRIEKLQAEGSIGYVLAEINRPERAEQDQSWYYEVLRYGDTEVQAGADLNAMWYLRNAKIFAKLMTVAEPGDRIVVLYGSGHNYWLRHFARMTPGYRSVDPEPYLRKAPAR